MGVLDKARQLMMDNVVTPLRINLLNQMRSKGIKRLANGVSADVDGKRRAGQVAGDLSAPENINAETDMG